MFCRNKRTRESTRSIYGRRLNWLHSIGIVPKYQASGKGWFALSYPNFNKMDYEKALVTPNGPLIELYFRYPAWHAEEWERELKVIISSFKSAS